jgi:hypothetical protein
MIFPALAPPLRKSPVRHSGSAWHFPPCRCGNDLVTESVHTSCSPGSPPTTRQLSSACSQPSDPRHTHPVLVRNHLHHFHLSIVLSPLAEPCLARSTVYTSPSTIATQSQDFTSLSYSHRSKKLATPPSTTAISSTLSIPFNQTPNSISTACQNGMQAVRTQSREWTSRWYSDRKGTHRKAPCTRTVSHTGITHT